MWGGVVVAFHFSLLSFPADSAGHTMLRSAALLMTVVATCAHVAVELAPPPAPSACGVLRHGVLFGSQHAFYHEKTQTAGACCDLCVSTQKCVAFNWEGDEDGTCYLQADADNVRPSHKNNTISGSTLPPPPNVPTATVSVGDHVVHRTDPGFRSWTIDASPNRGWEQRNLSLPKLHYLAGASTPGYMRFGGGGNDGFRYAVGANRRPCNVGEHCLNDTWFDNLMGFANASGARLVFGLDITVFSSSSGRWDPTGAYALMEYGIAKWGRDAFWGFELGNEDDNVYTAEHEAHDFAILSGVLDDLWGSNSSDRPRILGPDTHGFHDNITAKDGGAKLQFLVDFARNASALNVSLHALTHHEYVEVEEYLTAPPAASTLDLVGVIGGEVNATLVTELADIAGMYVHARTHDAQPQIYSAFEKPPFFGHTVLRMKILYAMSNLGRTSPLCH